MTSATLESQATSPSAAKPFFTSERVVRWMTAFLVLGIAARSVRFLLCFPLWEDECFLCINFIDRSFAELLTPLAYHQVSPPLFLWLERSAVLALGYSEWSLRLVPFAASIASLFLFRRIAERLLWGPALVLAFGCFAVAYPGIRYAAEAKQYSTDLFAALVLLAVSAEWYRTRKPSWLWLLALLAAPLLWLSYPAAFVVGGVSLAVGVCLVLPHLQQASGGRKPPECEARSVVPNLFGILGGLTPTARQTWIAWGAYNLAVLAGFGSLFFVISRQSGAELGFMTDYWKTAFPPISEPGRLPTWFLEVHTSDLLAWPVGGGRGASAFTAILAAIGVRQLLRKRDAFWGLMLLAPAAINLFAATMQRYPYGGHVKFSMYFGPAVCLLAGWGAAAWNAKVARARPLFAKRALIGTAAALMLVAGTSMCRDILHPYKTLSDERARAFARWFWFNAEAEGDVRVVDSFGDESFSSEAQTDLSWTAMFLCNRAIYSPTERAENITPISQDAARPLRCVIYRDPRFDFNEAARDGWLDEMRQTHELASVESFPFTRFGKNERDLVTIDYLDLYTFKPQPAQTAAVARPVWK